jgi:hypothetical protein
MAGAAPDRARGPLLIPGPPDTGIGRLDRILRRIFARGYRREAAGGLRGRQVTWGRPDPPSRQEIREMLRQHCPPRGIDGAGRHGAEDPSQVAAIRNLGAGRPGCA